MILLDANVFMYAGGADHPNRWPSQSLLRKIACGEVEAVVDAETLQEILHRYRAIGRWEDGRRVYDLARRAIPEVFPVSAEALDAARLLMDRYPGSTARDALHAAIALEVTEGRICSFNRDFDLMKGLRRIEPGDLL